MHLKVQDLGQLPLEQITESSAFKQAQATVNPWLWVFSVVGFVMAIMNTKRIAALYRTWRKPK